MINKFKVTMHQRPTYETLVRDTILEPKDKIALPNRQATQLRNMQQLNMFDDPSFVDLEELEEKITREKIQSETIRQSGGGDDSTHHVENAFRGRPSGPPTDFQAPPPPPAGGFPRMPHNHEKRRDTVEAGVQANGKPPPPPGGGGIKMMASSSTQVPKPQMFDLTIDDHMDDDNDDYKKFLAEQEK